jgi:hypothetical protein
MTLCRALLYLALAALAAIFVEQMARWMGADLTHWVEMRERPSLAWEPENDWERGRG